jgi:ribonucleoside-diphosphate reductase alpha chain
MRWLASRFLDVDLQEELGILTPQVRARRAAQDAATSLSSDTAGPHEQTSRSPGASAARPANVGPSTGGGSARGANGGVSSAPALALTDSPPVIPSQMSAALDLGPACQQCGGMMQRTGSCYTCSSCGFNTGCG